MRPLEQCILDRRDQSRDVWPVPYLEKIIAYQRKHLIPALVCHIKTMLALLHNINSCHVVFFLFFLLFGGSITCLSTCFEYEIYNRMFKKKKKIKKKIK